MVGLFQESLQLTQSLLCLLFIWIRDTISSVLLYNSQYKQNFCYILLKCLELMPFDREAFCFVLVPNLALSR